MGAFSHILAQPLAADRLWLVFLFLAALVIMGGLRALGMRIDAWHGARHFVRGLRAKKEGPKLHGEQ
jgi:hypothetical protein